MSSEPMVITAELAETRFCKSLRWLVHDPDEAMFIAATHRRKAADLQRRGLAGPHEQIASVCEQHAKDLAEAAIVSSFPSAA